MSFPNGELCVKRTGVGGKGRVSHTEEAYLQWCPHRVCAGLRGGVCVCVSHTRARERKADGVHVCESTHLSMPRCSKRVDVEIKGEIK